MAAITAWQLGKADNVAQGFVNVTDASTSGMVDNTHDRRPIVLTLNATHVFQSRLYIEILI